MKNFRDPASLRFAVLTTLACTVLSAALHAASPRLCETWQTGYEGADASGPHVLGYWRFQPDAPAHDSSGKGNELTFSGAKPIAEGKRDGALECFANAPGEDKHHGAQAAAKPGLSPRGAFTVEMWIKPKPDLAPNSQPFLLDKKYASNMGYQLRLIPAEKPGVWHLRLSLGFGDASEEMVSEAFALGKDWQHLAFTYDGAGGVHFFRNGAGMGIVRRPGHASVAVSRQPLSIGDRGGSTYGGFPGFIDEVRICEGVLEFRPVAVEFRTERKTWRRMEKSRPVTVVVRNLSKTAQSHLQLHLRVDGMSEKDVQMQDLAVGANQEFDYPFDTSLRPDTYRLKAYLEGPGDPPLVSKEETELTLVSRPLPKKMPVLLWGGVGVKEEIGRLKDIGFTHCFSGRTDYNKIWTVGKPTQPAADEQVQEEKATLDFALANDFGVAFSLSPGGWLKSRPELARVDRTGKPYARKDVNAALPGLAEFCFNVGASMAQTYDQFPAWQAALIDSEVRDDADVSFSKFDQERYRKFAGTDIPAEVVGKSGVDWTKLKNFPADRVIPDDDAILKFYRWYWTVGDGWNALHSAVHRGLKSTGRSDVWTWFDPAIRAPAIGGSGGDVDVLEQWSYTNPDPLRIGFFTDQLRAMAANSPQHPRVMKMTQLIMYRSQTAPKPTASKKSASAFDDHDPDAAYITTAPMHVREAFWTEIARPLDGLMYFGWEALVPTEGPASNRHTNPETQAVLRRLLHGVVEPLGPTLLQVGDHKADVAYLDSFTSQMFAHRGSYGYSGDEAYLTLLYAHLQPEVVYEAQVLKQGLDGFKVLVLADCDVLPAGVVQRIQEFQRRGGLVIGDENLAPAIKADLHIPKMKRVKKGDADKATLLADAAALRTALDAKYTRHVDSSNPDVVVRCRHAGASDYVFAVNDQREFGTYIGQHGMVMENGLPSEARLSLQFPGGHVYDLLTSREVKSSREGDTLRWPVNLGPCEGRIFLVSPEPIDHLTVTVSDSAPRGGNVKLAVSVMSGNGQTVPAVVPVQVRIFDPSGRPAEFSGFYGAKDGRLTVSLDIARNDAPGVWQVQVRELASGLEQSAYFRVQP